VFAAARTTTLVDVARLLEPVALPAGASLFQQGERGDSLYIVAQGRLRIHLGAQTVQEHGPGAVIGEMALIDVAPRMASATALSQALLLRLDHEPFFALLEEHGEVARGVLAQIAGRLRVVVRELAATRSAQLRESPSHA
jgi:CRP-like cAMP-binding protein